MLKKWWLLFLVAILICNSCLRTPNFTSYKRNMELVFKYFNKEYKITSVVTCKYLGKRLLKSGDYSFDWKSSISNKILIFSDGKKLELRNIFKGKEGDFYRDGYVEDLEEMINKGEFFVHQYTNIYTKYNLFFKIKKDYVYTVLYILWERLWKGELKLKSFNIGSKY